MLIIAGRVINVIVVIAIVVPRFPTYTQKENPSMPLDNITLKVQDIICI